MRLGVAVAGRGLLRCGDLTVLVVGSGSGSGSFLDGLYFLSACMWIKILYGLE